MISEQPLETEHQAAPAGRDTAPEETVTLQIDALPAVNYALQQNGIPALMRIAIVNDTSQALERVELRLSASPAFCQPTTLPVDYVQEGKTFVLRNPALPLDPSFLAGVTEKVKGSLEVSLWQGDRQLAAQNVEMTVLAFDQWHGDGIYPELLAAFVTPNHPALAKIIARAAELMKAWTGDPSMNAYLTQDRNRVLKQAAAIFRAIQEEKIVYCILPASFEETGQRIRLCDAVLQQKMGNCMDLTLLYAACLEAVGLRPLLLIVPRHIFSGVWLEELSFPEPVQDDPSVITKRLASGVNEIAVVETTLAVDGSTATFDAAMAAAQKKLGGTEPLDCVIDVHRARLSGITPIPQRIQDDQGWHVEDRTPAPTPEVPSAPKGIAAPVAVETDHPAEALPKMVQWERKLLDLGLRNNLINLRFSKTMVPLLASSLDELEDALASGKDFSVLPHPTDWKETGFEELPLLGAYESLIQSEFQAARLRSALGEKELALAVKELYRNARTSLEENGANTLYLALGLLRWYETAKSTKPRYAPLVLLPVEIARRSANRGYVLRMRDDDPQMNITILEKLKQDFGILVSGLDPLPTDEHGIDLRRVFTTLRKAVMGQPHWDVLESAYLGIFSFSQFVMWNDLRNRSEDLVGNKIVRSLMDGKLAWDAKPMEIGDRVPEDGVLLPMPADASQLYAIEAACRGESFVLHGPPGTGKSQTITSLIANALAQGKSVLFVAEKMAALEVVQKRLESIGIGPFCLELHSNRSRKKDVLEQLRRAAEVTKYQTPEQYAQKAEQLAGLRRELDDYAQALHKTRPWGGTMYDLINEYEEYRNAPELPRFPETFLRSLDQPTMEAHRILLERLVAAGRAVGHPQGHPLSPVGLTSYSQKLRLELPEVVNAYAQALARAAGPAEEFTGGVGWGPAPSFAALEKAYGAAKELLVWAEIPKAWAVEENFARAMGEIREMAGHFRAAAALHNALSQNWTELFFQQDGAQLLTEYQTAAAKWAVPKLFALGSLKKRLGAFAKTPVDKDRMKQDLTDLWHYQEEWKEAQSLFEKYGDGLGDHYSGSATDWEKIAALAEAAENSDAALTRLTGGSDFRRAFCGDPTLWGPARRWKEGFEALLPAREACRTLLAYRDPEESGGDWIAAQRQCCEQLLAHRDQLKEYISLNGILAETEQAGLEAVADFYRNGAEHGQVFPAYRKAVLTGLITLALEEDGVLNNFSGPVFNEKIRQYKRIDGELTRLSQQEVYCRLASRVPNFTNAAVHSSELGILQRMIKSNGRGTSIRKLLEQLPNLLPRLCPCMLMSPISAAQYLDPKREPFDIVVFDEASQLPTCKAVGVLARGKDAVIVGDPKQMPPTSFFAVNTVDEDNLDVEDLESILDDCLAINMPQTHLLWHYRSRHESLIAFSNCYFYENRLYTFPSVNERASKVSLVHVEGVFERGRSRKNQKEAEAVVAEIKRRCHDPLQSGQSLGVVTFNISQQNLIDDLLSEECASDPELEKWLYESEEPVFIKNLENVQGDERDVILFSVGYGPDQRGKVSLNFGPLNREGGWRRLNVAVSRARCEMMVFTSMTPDQINLSRTSAEGVAALKAFLEYASGRELPADGREKAHRGKDGIAKSIRDALKREGFDADLSVGHSAYRMDLGVVNPQDPETYLLGILLDGDLYGTAKTTRDREVAQISVLSGLGWEVLRVWTMDWWDNPQKELDRILCRLRQLQAGEEPDSPEEEEAVQLPLTQSAVSQSQSPVTAYRAVTLRSQGLSPEDFASGQYDRAISQAIQRVVQREAPISRSLLTRRVVQSFGLARAGTRIQEHVDALCAAILTTRQMGERIYWGSQRPEAYRGIRVSGEGIHKREIKDVPVQEAANALCYVLEQQISLPGEDLLREGAKLMGYLRPSDAGLELFALALEYARKQGRVLRGTNGNWTLEG